MRSEQASTRLRALLVPGLHSSQAVDPIDACAKPGLFWSRPIGLDCHVQMSSSVPCNLLSSYLIYAKVHACTTQAQNTDACTAPAGQATHRCPICQQFCHCARCTRAASMRPVGGTGRRERSVHREWEEWRSQTITTSASKVACKAS